MSQPTQYPDMLGQMSEARLVVDGILQCALGVFPTTTALDRPVEALLLMQNMTDRPLGVRVTVHTPTHGEGGRLVNLFTPKPRLDLTLPAAECGLLHLPVIPQLPTPTGARYTVRVGVRVAAQERHRLVREPQGGPPPNLLAMSPFRLAVLRDIAFAADSPEPGQLAVSFEVLGGELPPLLDGPAPRYEPLWTLYDLEQETRQLQEIAPEALSFARTLSRANLHPLLLDRTVTRFAQIGMPLHPGEAMAIARALIYVMEDGLELEQGFSKVESYWFQRLCHLMLSDREVLDSLDRLVGLLYTAMVHDAVLLGFHMVGYETRANFGDRNEQERYATRLVGALEGRVPVALEHVYVPLVMMGLILHGKLKLPGENLWTSLDDLQEARDGRTNLAGGAFGEVFDILNRLIARADQLLRELRIPRD